MLLKIKIMIYDVGFGIVIVVIFKNIFLFFKFIFKNTLEILMQTVRVSNDDNDDQKRYAIPKMIKKRDVGPVTFVF